MVLVEAGDIIPADGEVIEGVASVDESAITGESAPVIRESGGDFSSVTGGTRVLSDWIVVRGRRQSRRDVPRPHDLHGRRRQAPEDPQRDRPRPSCWWRMTLVFLVVIVTLLPFSLYSVEVAKVGQPVTITALVALLVCLIPTTIGGLLSAIGVAGMSRMMQANVIATSGRAVEAAGRRGRAAARQDRHHHARQPAGDRLPAGAGGDRRKELADAAQFASLADETPEGRSIVVLAKQRFGLRRADIQALGAQFVPFSRADPHERRRSSASARQIRKGAADAIEALRPEPGRPFRRPSATSWRTSRKQGSTPLVVADGGAGARGGRAQGHRQGRHQGAIRRAAPAWASRPS